MPRDSSGNYSLPAVGNPVVTGTTISSTWANTTLSDIATALTDSLDRSGEGGMLASLQLFNGLIGAPGLSWSSEPTSGLYRSAAGDFRYSIGAADKIQITANGIRVVDGAVGTPSFSFISDTDTGIFRNAANDMRLVVGGASIITLLSNQATFSTAIGAADGLVGTPSITFSADTDTGIFRNGANDMRLVSGGAIVFSVVATGGFARMDDGTAAVPSFAFFSDTDTGVYRRTNNAFSITAGGVFAIEFQNNAGSMQGFAADGSATNPFYSFLLDTDTGFYRDTANQIGLALGGVTAGQIAQGSFTGTFANLSGTPTATIKYMRVGMIGILFIPAVTANSVGTSQSITGLPAIMQPASISSQNVEVTTFAFELASTNSFSVQFATGSGTITAFKNGDPNGFSNGVSGYWKNPMTVVYSLA